MAGRLDHWVGDLREKLPGTQGPVLANGLLGGSRALLLSSLFDTPFTSALILAPTPDQADSLAEDIKFFVIHRGLDPARIVRFPSLDTLIRQKRMYRRNAPEPYKPSCSN